MGEAHEMEKKQYNRYLIALEEKRSKVALAAGICVFFFTLAAVLIAAEQYISAEENPLHYFTLLSNLWSAAAAAFMIPYAAEGIRKKRFVLPKWIVLFQYAGATCVSITMISALLIILPTQGMMALSGTNFWLHIVTPVCTVVLFESVESGVSFTRRDMLWPLVPYFTYMLVYFIMVIVIGEENGGWSDFYWTQAFWPAGYSALLMAAVGIAAALIMRAVHNRRALNSWESITRLWSDDLEPAELLTEAFGLGRYIGSKGIGAELNVPVDIFRLMSERYGIPVEKLTGAFIKGALDADTEKNQQSRVGS